ncbi:MAG: class I SAM-dependent methyltransferase [Desulfobulbus sp.]|nr:class I SAM-dependent methyltransferase [Desulfobulbus sp.]
MPEHLSSIALWAAPDVPGHQAENLAGKLAIPYLKTLPKQGPLLCLGEDRLEFRLLGEPEFTGGLWVDFDSTAARRRSRHTGSELLVQAAKIRRVSSPLLIDTTAGLGRDAFLLATHGFRVEMIEVNPVVAALLADGLARASKVQHLQLVIERIRLNGGNSVERLAALTEIPEVIYLDPMFPERSKSAKVKQNLRLLQYLDDHLIAPESLLQAALLVGANKVVVKRPLKGPFLAGKVPSYTLKGKAIRFDVYLGPGKKEPLDRPGEAQAEQGVIES